MTLVKTSLLNGIAVLVRMISLLGMNKILAMFVGPSGYAVFGQFYNAVQLITNFSSGAINTGVTKYTAEYGDDLTFQKKIWKTAGTIAISGSIIFSVLIFFLSGELAGFFLNDESLAGVFKWFASFLTLFVINTLLLAILNGRKEIKSYVIANIAGSLLSLVLTIWLGATYKLYGALVALGTYQSIAFFVTLYLCWKKEWFNLRDMFGHFDLDIAKNLAKYTVMSLTTAICVPITHMLIREYLGKHLGWDSAGLWEAMWRLSSAYLLLITATLSVYYLPRISELKKVEEVRSEIWNCFKLTIPFSILLGLVIYLLRDFVIEVLFSRSFLPMRSLFLWQLIGDTVKVGSWILAYVFIGKGMVKYYVFSEIIFTFSFFFIIVALEPHFGLESVAIGHALNYLLHFGFVYLALKKIGYVK